MFRLTMVLKDGTQTTTEWEFWPDLSAYINQRQGRWTSIRIETI